MDYCSNGELLSWNAKNLRFSPFMKGQDQLSETDIKKYMRHIVRGLHYSKIFIPELITYYIVHLNNIVHRDIKP